MNFVCAHINFKDIQIDFMCSYLSARQWFICCLAKTPQPVEVEAITAQGDGGDDRLGLIIIIFGILNLGTCLKQRETNGVSGI